MLKWLVSIVFASAFLLGGAVIALEAMGLIFLAAPDDPERGIHAVVAQIEASVDPRDLPSEGEAEGLWPPPAEKQVKEEAKENVKEDRAALLPVDVTDAGPPTAAAVVEAWKVRVLAEAESAIEAERDVLDLTPPAPKLVAAGKTADTIVSLPVPRGAKACKGACNIAQAPAPRRARTSETGCHFPCPSSGLLAVSLP